MSLVHGWRPALRRLATCAALLGGVAGAWPAAHVHAGEARAAVAANFSTAVQQLAAAFARDSGHTVVPSLGSTGALYAQIRNGAPYDVFLAADAERPQRLEQEGIGVAGTRFTYATGRIALWSATRGLVNGGPDVLRGNDFRTLAIANPKTAPYGAAAQQVLERLGLWDALQGRIVRGENIAQAFQFVATGNAALGFVALAQLKAQQPHADAWVPPQTLHAPIEQQAILLTRSADHLAARAFLAYLRTPPAHALIESLGYGVQ